MPMNIMGFMGTYAGDVRPLINIWNYVISPFIFKIIPITMQNFIFLENLEVPDYISPLTDFARRQAPLAPNFGFSDFFSPLVSWVHLSVC